MCFTKLSPQKSNIVLSNDFCEFQFGEEFVDSCDYINEEKLLDTKINHTDLSLIQFNIRGLLSKQTSY